MRRTALAVEAAALVGLSACAHVEHFSGPHGEDIYRVACNGDDSSLADCSTDATDACGGNGYRTIDTKDDECWDTHHDTGPKTAYPCRSLAFVCGTTADLASGPFVGTWEGSGSLDPICTAGSAATLAVEGAIKIAPGGPGDVILTGGTIGAGCVTHFAIVSGPVAGIETPSATCVARTGTTTRTTQFKKNTLTLDADGRTLSQEVDYVLKIVGLERGSGSACEYRGAVRYTRR